MSDTFFNDLGTKLLVQCTMNYVNIRLGRYKKRTGAEATTNIATRQRFAMEVVLSNNTCKIISLSD